MMVIAGVALGGGGVRAVLPHTVCARWEPGILGYLPDHDRNDLPAMFWYSGLGGYPTVNSWATAAADDCGDSGSNPGGEQRVFGLGRVYTRGAPTYLPA